MAQVSYHGEYPEGQDFIEQHGYAFEQGKSVDVKEDYLLSKFAQNRFFKTAKSDKEELQRGEDEAEKAESQTLREYLDDHSVPYRANASLDNLRKAKADYDKSVEAVKED